MCEIDSLSGAMESAAKDVPETVAAPVEQQEPVEAAWEAPGWTKRWKEPSRNALKALRDHPEARAHLDPLLKELDETYGYVTKRDQEYAQYRRQLDPIAEVIGPYVNQLHMQGMSPQQFVQQLVATQEAMRSNPDQTFPHLAGMFKPRDANQVIKALAQQWGADLGAITQEAPYIDPALQQMLGGYHSELSQLKQSLWQQQQGQLQAQQAAVLNDIAAFESAADESGNPKHPHYREVYDDMVMLIQMGRASSLPQAYDMAVRFNPKLSASMAEQQALKDAARQTAEAKQAAEASRNVSGKPKGRPGQASSIEEAMRKAEKELGAH
jgi:hypothetical protein